MPSRTRAAATLGVPPRTRSASARPPGVLCSAAPSRAAATAVGLHRPPVSPAGYGASRLPAGGPPRLRLRSPRRTHSRARRAVTRPPTERSQGRESPGDRQATTTVAIAGAADPGNIANLVVKAIHDKMNLESFDVENGKGMKWKTFGTATCRGHRRPSASPRWRSSSHASRSSTRTRPRRCFRRRRSWISFRRPTPSIELRPTPSG